MTQTNFTPHQTPTQTQQNNADDPFGDVLRMLQVVTKNGNDLQALGHPRYRELQRRFQKGIECCVSRLTARGRTHPSLSDKREELQQELSIKVLTKLDKFEPGRGKGTTWLYTVARNHMTDSRRKSANDPLSSDNVQGGFVTAEGEELSPLDKLDSSDRSGFRRGADAEERVAMQDLLVKVREQFVLAEKEDDFRAWVQRDGLQWSIAEIAEDLYGEEYTQSDKARQSQIHNRLSQRLRRTRNALCEWVAQAKEKGLL